MRRFASTTLAVGALLVVALSTVPPALTGQSHTDLTGTFHGSQPTSQIVRQLRQGTPPDRRGLVEVTNQEPPRALTREEQPQVVLPPGYDPIGFDECWQHEDDATFRGWGKHRFAVCHIQRDWFYAVVECDDHGNCEMVYSVAWDFTLIATGSNGTRDVTFQIFVTNLRPSNQAILDSVTLIVQTACSGVALVPSGPECHTSDLQTSRTFRQWQSTAAALPQTYTSDETSGVDPDLRTAATYLLSVNALDPHVPGPDPGPVAGQPHTDLRFDSANYINFGSESRPAGAVFLDVSPVLHYRLSDFPNVAGHIQRAQQDPNSTMPPPLPDTDKEIPGAPFGASLSRLTDESLQRRNNDQAGADCLTYFADQYPNPDLDCDEYPFESTWQGAYTSSSSQRYSVQPLPSSENRSAGNALGQWYFNDRILEGDTFWVQIDP